MQKHHRKTVFKGIPSRTTIHVSARPTSKAWKYFTDTVLEEDKRKKKELKEKYENAKESNGNGEDL